MRRRSLPAGTSMILFTLVLPAAVLAGDLDNLFNVRSARTKRASSANPEWRNTNQDNRQLPAGETLTLAELQGPGVVRHIWFTIAAPAGWGRWLTLRMYWDGQEEPAVETPIGDFFAVGHGALTAVDSLPVAVSSEGRALNCYWPMPFAKSAKLTLTNDSKEAARAIYYYVDYEEVDELPSTTAFFHAQYRQEYPAKMGEDYLILDAEGRGHYVGTVLSVALRTRGWFGEGDDRFYIDGAAEPQLRGTGTEDYFCDAWGFRVLNRPFYGITLNGLDRGRDFGDLITAYRWHVNDPVHFARSLKVTIEDKGNVFDASGRQVSGFMERSDLMSSVAFWYQTGKAKRFTTLPPAEERSIPTEVIQFEGMVKDAKAEPSSTPVEAQRGRFNGGAQLWVKFANQPGEVTIPFKLEKALAGIATLRLTTARDYGTFEVLLDGKALSGMKALDLYAPAVTSSEFGMGYVDLVAGDHELKFKCVGKNDKSTGYYLGVDGLEVARITKYVLVK
ncbi:MAG TPA: DUF2961 domain-containing protein [Phycisphaerae bacterium]|nr:DUF2961 domain-containing protein [Phycisphaerae bacterium]HRY66541.1 DUF2961 domain-containing protein [Phycisphaerae bacterium]